MEAITSYAPVFEIQSPELEEGEIGGFSLEEIHMVGEDKPAEVSSVIASIIKKMNFFPGMGLGLRQQGIREAPLVKGQKERFGLGYEPTKEERVKRTFKKKNEVELKPYCKTLNGQFVKEGDDFP